MNKKINDKQMGYDQSFCSYNNDHKIVTNPYKPHEREVYKTRNNHVTFLLTAIVIFVIIILCIVFR